jgi:hypothetical protein
LFSYLGYVNVDDDVTWLPNGTVTNREPLWIAVNSSVRIVPHAPGVSFTNLFGLQLQYQPNATTEISNFFLASDYVLTTTAFASMEAANVAARMAVQFCSDCQQYLFRLSDVLLSAGQRHSCAGESHRSGSRSRVSDVGRLCFQRDAQGRLRAVCAGPHAYRLVT